MPPKFEVLVTHDIIVPTQFFIIIIIIIRKKEGEDWYKMKQHIKQR